MVCKPPAEVLPVFVPSDTVRELVVIADTVNKLPVVGAAATSAVIQK